VDLLGGSHQGIDRAPPAATGYAHVPNDTASTAIGRQQPKQPTRTRIRKRTQLTQPTHATYRTGGIVTGKAGLAHTRTIVNDQGSNFVAHLA
jgi:hypothetical protein